MQKKLGITEARKKFLSLPDDLKSGEEVQIYRHHQPVLKIVRMVGEPSETDPFVFLDEALKNLPSPKRSPPKSLARQYKSYRYGQKG